jgi:hypothetical protein
MADAQVAKGITSHAPSAQAVATIGHKIARHGDLLSLAAITQHPTVPSQSRIGEQQAYVVRKVVRMCRSSVSLEIVGRGDKNAIAVGQTSGNQARIEQLRNPDRNVNVASIKIDDRSVRCSSKPTFGCRLRKAAVAAAT